MSAPSRKQLVNFVAVTAFGPNAGVLERMTAEMLLEVPGVREVWLKRHRDLQAALSSEDATRPTPSTERPLMPSVPAGDGFFAAEGDERCGRVHIAARARCLMPKGHTGNHANTQGYWLDSEAADGWPEHVEASDCDGLLNADGTCPHGFGRTCCATRPTGDKE